MAKFCGNCGSPLNNTSVFCGGCGTRVPAAAPAPVAAAFTPAPVTAPAAGFTSVPAAFTPAPAVTPDSGGFSSVPAAFTPAPVVTPDAGGFSAVPASFAPAPVTTSDAGFTSVPAAFTPAPPITPDAGGFSSVPAAFTPAPVATPAGFTSVPAAYTPPPVAPAPPPIPPVAPYAANNAGYAPVGSGAGPTSVPYTQTPAAYAPPPPGYTPAQAVAGGAYPAKKSNTLLKLVIAFVLIIFVGGALALAGLWYAAQQIKAKAHTVASQILGGTSPAVAGASGSLGSGASAAQNGDGGIQGDPCRFLSKAEVGQAVGLPIIRTEAQESGCAYIAKGDPADVTAKHLSSMLGGMGVDAQTQKMAQKFAGGLFAQQQATDKDLSAQAAKGEIPVLTLVFTAGHAATEMKLNRGAFEHIKGNAPFGGGLHDNTSTDLPGIGDEAYVAGGGMLMLRKGNVMARMMYVSCPCNTDNIKPLAQTLASRL